MNEITKPESADVQQSVTVRPDSAPSDIRVEAAEIAAKIVELASNPSLNPEMFDRLVVWQERQQDRQAEMAYNAAMNAAQAEIQPVARTAENTQTRSFYAKLETVDAAIRPIYLKHGFSLEYNTVAPLTDGHIRVECRCSHREGHSRLFYREAPADTLGPKGSAVKTVLHGGGSTETYLKRYLACGVFNVVFKNQDDDGVRGGTKFIGAEKAEGLRELARQVGRQEGPFLDRMFAGSVHSFDELEDGPGYLAVHNTLLQLKQRKQGA